MIDFANSFELDAESQDAVKSQINKTISQAKVCLNNADFAEYKKQFIASRDKMVRSMITFTNSFMLGDSGDMSFYGAKMCRMITKLQDLQVLLDAVDLDVRKEKHLDE